MSFREGHRKYIHDSRSAVERRIGLLGRKNRFSLVTQTRNHISISIYMECVSTIHRSIIKSGNQLFSLLGRAHLQDGNSRKSVRCISFHSRSSNLPQTHFRLWIHRDENIVLHNRTERQNFLQQEESQLFCFLLINHGNTVNHNKRRHVVGEC